MALRLEKRKLKIRSAQDIISPLHGLCGKAIDKSFLGGNALSVSRNLLFANEISAWVRALSDRPESQLYSLAENEYLISLLNLCQGQYRNAFKGLRLVLELCLQGVYLSANLILLNEWLKNEGDTIWTATIDSENGVFSRRFCKAFFPDAAGHSESYSTMTRTLYREFSECIHGNVPFHIPLPLAIEFNEETFKLWHEKAETVRLIVHFALTMRYLKHIAIESRSELEGQVIDVLGHIKSIRNVYEGGEYHER